MLTDKTITSKRYIKQTVGDLERSGVRRVQPTGVSIEEKCVVGVI